MQKGIVAMTYPDMDMPCTVDGITPSLIINPHAIPSRMTVGQFIESLAGNLAAAKGTFMDGSIFNYNNIDAISDELKKLGLDPNGEHRLINGLTGEYIDTKIFMGPVYYQRLQKFVVDQVYAVSHGPSDATTRQQLDGKALNGGMRIGEMERDVICAHGASRFLSEKFFDHSDGFYIYICVRCGNYAIVNHDKKMYICTQCKDMADIYEFPCSWSSKLLFQELNAMQIGYKFIAEPIKFQRYE